MVGNVNDAIIIAVNWIFDSNNDKALPLVKEALDLICYYLDGDYRYLMFEIMYYEVRYVNTKFKLNLTE